MLDLRSDRILLLLNGEAAVVLWSQGFVVTQLGLEAAASLVQVTVAAQELESF